MLRSSRSSTSSYETTHLLPNRQIMSTLRERGPMKRHAPRSPRTRESHDSNPLVAHNEQHRALHLILALLLAFCLFLILSLCSPDLIGIDNSFQEIFYPTSSHSTHFLLVYGPMMNRESNLRSLIRFTPKSAQNGYVLHDHFDPDNDRDTGQLLGGEVGDDPSVESDSDDLSSEFAVRVHHLRRSFSFDTALLYDSDDTMDSVSDSVRSMNESSASLEQNVNGSDIESLADIESIADIELPNEHIPPPSFTALGVQLDQQYESTVNGILLRIDADCLVDLDSNESFGLFRREQIPLQWIEFLYSKPREFEAMKNPKGPRGHHQATAHQTANHQISRHQQLNEEDEPTVVQPEDIDNANSMMHQEAEIELEEVSDHGMNNDSVRSMFFDRPKHRDRDKLEQLNADNERRYQLNVWTYILPTEIMMKEEDAQTQRVMLQSYIDEVLSGCLDVGGQEFAKEFIRSTSGWNPFASWTDDRIEEEEGALSHYHFPKIDALLKRYVFKK